MAYDGASGQTVMFGGASSPGGGGLLSETWTWDGSGWTQQSPSASPPARAYAVEAYDTVTGTTVLTGGAGDGAALSDTWTWNNTTWSSVDPSSSPPARVGAAGAYDAGGRQLVVFGGAGKGGSALDDTVILTAEAPLVITPGATSPAPPGSGSDNSSGTATGPISSSVSPSTSRPGTTPVSRTATPRAATSYNVHRGDLVTLTGSGFEPGTDITITFHSTPYVVGHTLAGAAGDFRVTVGVPERAAIGRHHFIAQGAGASGQLTELVTAVQVVPFAGGPSRRSPVQTAVMVFVAVAIPVGSWFALSLAGRLRRRSRHRSPARAVPRP